MHHKSVHTEITWKSLPSRSSNDLRLSAFKIPSTALLGTPALSSSPSISSLGSFSNWHIHRHGWWKDTYKWQERIQCNLCSCTIPWKQHVCSIANQNRTDTRIKKSGKQWPISITLTTSGKPYQVTYKLTLYKSLAKPPISRSKMCNVPYQQSHTRPERNQPGCWTSPVLLEAPVSRPSYAFVKLYPNPLLKNCINMGRQ